MYGAFGFHLVGMCGRDAESTVLPNGTKRCTVTIVVNTPEKNAQGEYEERATWVRIAFFGQAAERKQVVACKKGNLVYVEGVVQSFESELADGKRQTRYNFKPTILRCFNLARRSDRDEDGSEERPGGEDTNSDDFA